MKYVREKDIHKNVSRVISGFVISDNFYFCELLCI